jgi:hypothetical protein
MKQAYKKVFADVYKPIELTGLCKRVDGPLDFPRFYKQVRVRFLGIPIYKYWMPSRSICMLDPTTETIYRCDEKDE